MRQMIGRAVVAAALALGAVPAAAQQSFDEWVAGFRSEALNAGITAQTFDSAFEGVALNPRVLELDAYQPEFSRPIWDYLDGAVSDRRIANGQEQLATYRELLDLLEARHHVDRHIIVAIWGLESAYGEVKGSFNIIEALATLAYDGRRAGFAHSQLIAALQILQEGAMAPEDMIGSWAGAMGHTQFIPTSYLEYGVDHEGDGRRDLVGNHQDALASTASYLARFGWIEDWRWGREVILPDGFSFTNAGDHIQQSLSEWRALGVLRADGQPLPDDPTLASVIIPGGAEGPAFLIYQNFRVIKHYNNSTAYALAVGHLADRLAGGSGFVGTWPRDSRALSFTEREEMQSLLNAAGYDAGSVDGIIGAQTNSAVRAFQGDQGLAEDGFATSELLELLRGN